MTRLFKSVFLFLFTSLICLSCSNSDYSFDRFKSKVSHLKSSPFVRANIICELYDIDGYCSFSMDLYKVKQYSYSGELIDDGTRFSTVDKIVDSKSEELCVELINISARDFVEQTLYTTYSTSPNLKIKNDDGKNVFIYEFNKYGDLTIYHSFIDGIITRLSITYYDNYDYIGK